MAEEILDDGLFAELMDNLGLLDDEWSHGLAVGVSGGADSTALAILGSRWAARKGIPFLAITCDHGLRPEAADEARSVARQLFDLDVACHVLHLNVSKEGSIQNNARNARYAGMLDVMRKRGLGVLAVGHHLLDQAETVEHRLSGGAISSSALAGMQPVRVAEDALLVRPFLTIHPSSMKAYLKKNDISWIEDPSNSNPKFTRVRIRQMLAENPERIDELIKIATSSAAELSSIRTEAQEILSNSNVAFHPSGITSFPMDITGTRQGVAEALRNLVMRASGAYPSTSDDTLLGLLARGSGTLSGAALWQSGKQFWLTREMAAIPTQSVLASPWGSWDGRIRFGQRVPGRATVGSMGDVAATEFRRKHSVAIPHRALMTMPVLRRDGRVISIPELHFGETCEVSSFYRKTPSLTLKTMEHRMTENRPRATILTI